MNWSRSQWLVAAVLLFAQIPVFAQTGSVLLTFDDVSAGTLLGNLYQSQGVVFSNTLVQNSIFAPSPPHDITSAGGGPIEILFPAGAKSVSVQIDTDGYNTDRQPQIRIYDKNGSLLGTKLFQQGPDVESFQAAGIPIYRVLLGSCHTYGDSSCASLGFSDAYDNVTFELAALSITTSSLPGGTVGSAYSQSLAATGGIPPYTWFITSGALPDGLALAGSTIAGTPTANGTFNFTVQVTDNVGGTATQALSITVGAAGPIISVAPASLDFGPVGLNNVRTKRLLIRNTGPADSVLTGSIQQPSAPFSITSGGSAFSLASGRSQFVNVAFDPTSPGTFSDQIVINSNDPATPSVSVLLEGEVVQSVRLWINAFIPDNIPGLTFTAPAPFSPSTVFRGPEPLYQLIGALYFTDQRSFSSDPTAPARMHSEVSLDITFGPLFQSEVERTFPTVEIGQLFPEPYSIACVASADNSRMHFHNLRGTPDQIQIDISAAASNPCTAPICTTPDCHPLLPTPDIDYTGTITINVPARTISFSGFIDSFPAFEMYAVINNRSPVTVFAVPPPTGNDPWNLFGPPTTPVNASVPFSN